jgi:predicted  nucleic acid-binding Zn-ribbon protein
MELLIILQDLDMMLAEISDAAVSTKVKKMGLKLDGHDKLRESRTEVASRVDRALLAHYDKLHTKFPRAVVPVKDGICLGCFVRQPATRKPKELDLAVATCQRCQRILFDLRDV